MARQQGERSSFAHKKRGAVLAKDNKIVATGVNAHLDETGAPAKTKGLGESERYVATVNAEIIAIGSAVRANVYLGDLTMYISDPPNWVTFKFIVALGLKRIVHYGTLQSERIKHYAQALGIEILSVG